MNKSTPSPWKSYQIFERPFVLFEAMKKSVKNSVEWGEYFTIDSKTIQRTIAKLKEDFKIKVDSTPEGYVITHDGYLEMNSHNSRLTDNEIYLILSSLRNPRPFMGNVQDKLKRVLVSMVSDNHNYSTFKNEFGVRERLDESFNPRLFAAVSTINQAIINSRTIRITYNDSGEEPVMIEVFPRNLKPEHGGYVLHAQKVCGGTIENKVSTFWLSNIQGAEISEMTIDPLNLPSSEYERKQEETVNLFLTTEGMEILKKSGLYYTLRKKQDGKYHVHIFISNEKRVLDIILQLGNHVLEMDNKEMTKKRNGIYQNILKLYGEVDAK